MIEKAEMLLRTINSGLQRHTLTTVRKRASRRFEHTIENDDVVGGIKKSN